MINFEEMRLRSKITLMYNKLMGHYFDGVLVKDALEKIAPKIALK